MMYSSSPSLSSGRRWRYTDILSRCPATVWKCLFSRAGAHDSALTRPSNGLKFWSPPVMMAPSMSISPSSSFFPWPMVSDTSPSAAAEDDVGRVFASAASLAC